MASLQGGTLRDRTSEFRAIAERLQKQQGVTSSNLPESGALPSVKSAIQQKSDFAKKASEIGLGIHKTSAKLQKLSQLAKRTSMFDDPAQEINELTGVIKQDIQGLNATIAELQAISSKSRDGNAHTQHHSTTVVDNLRTRLKDTTQEFKEVLTLRTENLKGQQDRQQLFSSSKGGFGEAEPLLARPGGAGKSARSLFGGPSDEVSDGPSTSGMSQQQQQQQMQLSAPQDQYLASRNEALHNVESTIVELGGIFQQLAHMVAEQGEMAIRIDQNVDETLTNVGNAQTQLLKYLNGISSNRWLIMKVFFVLMLFLVIFVVFIA